MTDDTHDEALDPDELGAGQGGGTGGLVGNEGSAESPDPSPTREDDPDAWDAHLADDEQIPDRDDPDLPGAPLEADPIVDDLQVPGAPQRETGDLTEGGSGRPGPR